MTHYARRYQLRIHQRGTVEPTDQTVDFVLESEIKERPTIPGPVARPLDGRTETQPWTLPVVDADGVIVSRLADTGGRMHLLGRIAEFREHDGTQWEIIYTGRIAGLSESTPGRWDVRIADERWLERRRDLFTRSDTTMVWPAGARYVWRRGANYRSGWTFRVDIGAAPGMRVLRVTTDRPVRGDSGASDWTRAGIELVHSDVVGSPRAGIFVERGNYETLRLRLGGYDCEIVGFDSRRVSEVGPRIDVPADTLHESLEEGEPLRTVWVLWPEGEPLPDVGDEFPGFIYAPDHEPTDVLPLHIGVQDPTHEWGADSQGIPPFEAVRRGYEACGIRYDPAAFADLNLGGYGLAAWRIRRKQKLAAWAERHVYQPALVLPFVDNRGRISPRPLTPPPGLDPSRLFVFDASNTKAPYPTWDHQDGEVRNVVEAEYEAEFMPPEGSSSLDGIETEVRRRDPIRHSTVLNDLAPEHPTTIDLSGWQDGPAPGPVRDPLTGIVIDWPGLDGLALSTTHLRHALHTLDRFGDGPITQVVYGTEDTREVQAGDWVLIDQDSLKGPNPATNARSGLRLVQIMRRDILPVGYRFEVLDGGPALQPLSTPTVNIAQDGTDPRHGVTVTVGNVDPHAERVVVQLAYEEGFTEIIHEVELEGAGSTTVRPVASGTTIYARPQARASMRTPSLWGTTASVSTASLSAPTGLSATVSGRTIRLDWTPTHDEYALVPTLDGEPVVSSPLPPGSTSYVFAGLEEATQYSVGVRHVDPWGGMSPIASLSRTAGASTQLAGPRRIRILQGRADPTQPSGSMWGRLFSMIGIGLEVAFVAVERYAHHRVQVATTTTFDELVFEGVVPPGRETARLPTPMVTDRLYVRTRAEREGFSPSDWSDIVSAYATTLQDETPASDHFPGGWADARVEADGEVVITIGSDDPDTDRTYYAASIADYPEVDSSSPYVDRSALPAIVDPGITLQPDQVVYITIRYWNAVSGFGQGLRLSRPWAKGPKGDKGDPGPPGPGVTNPRITLTLEATRAEEQDWLITAVDWQGSPSGLQYRYVYHLPDTPHPGWPNWSTLPAGGVVVTIPRHESLSMRFGVQVREQATPDRITQAWESLPPWDVETRDGARIMVEDRGLWADGFTGLLGLNGLPAETAALQVQEPGQNLLGPNAAREYVTTGQSATWPVYWGSFHGGAALPAGVEPGGVVALTCIARSHAGDDVGVRVTFFDSAGVEIADHSVTTDSPTEEYLEIPEIEVPAAAVRMRVRMTQSGGTAGGTLRNVMLTLGPLPMRFTDPPGRPNRDGIEVWQGALNPGVQRSDGARLLAIAAGMRIYEASDGDRDIAFDEPYQDAPAVIVIGPMAYKASLSGSDQYRLEYADDVTGSGIGEVVMKMTSMSGIAHPVEPFPSAVLTAQGESRSLGGSGLGGKANDGKYTARYGVAISATAEDDGFSRVTVKVTVSVDTSKLSSPGYSYRERATAVYAVTAEAGQVRNINAPAEALTAVDTQIADGDQVRVRIKAVEIDTRGAGGVFSIAVTPIDLRYTTYAEQKYSQTPNGQKGLVIVFGAT